MSRWIDVAKSASALADAVSPAPVAGLSVDLLIAISGAQDAQTALLSSIDRNVALIRTGPFRAAQEHLSSARDYGPEHSEYQHELRAARFSFVAALGQTDSQEEQSFIRYHLGLVELLRGDTEGAKRELTKSYQLCEKVVLTRVWFPPSKRESLRWQLISGIGSLPPFVVNHLRKHASLDGRGMTMLAGYAPFVSAVARTLNAVAGTATYRGLAIDGFELEWTAPEN